MALGDYLAGVVLFTVVFGAAAGGALALLRRRFAGLRGAEAVTAFGVLLSAALLIIHLVPATLGLLSRGSVVIASALWLAGCLRVSREPARGAEPASPRSTGRPRSRLSWPAAALSAGLIAVIFVAYAKSQAVATSGSIDFSTFHLPNVIGWIQSGSIWQADNFLPDSALGNYPNNGDVMLLAFVLPWHNDFFVHPSMWMFYGFSGAAVYGLARRLGAIRPLAILAACLILAMPSVTIPALPNAMTDAVAVFGLAAGLLFLVRYARSRERGDLVLAGVALGICFGTKWYSVSTAVIVVAVWLVARLVQRHPVRTIAREGAVLTGLVGLFGGVWLLRNWILSGNPIFPVKVELGGVTVFDAPPDVIREQAGFTILDYIGDWGVWWRVDLPGMGGQADGILLQWLDALAGPALLIALALLVVFPLAARRPRAWAGIWLALACAALMAVAYVITPYTAGGPEGIPLLVGADSRYVVPALLAGAVAIAAVATGRRAMEMALAILAPIAVIHGLERAGSGDLSPAMLTAGDWAVGVAGALVLAGGFVCLRRMRPPGRFAGVAALSLFALLAVAGGQVVQERFNELRYTGSDPVIDRVADPVEGGREIALAGLWSDDGTSPILPAFGPRFENHVEYVGEDDEGMLRRYETRDAFIAAIEDRDPDAVVIGRGRPGVPAIMEGEWLSSAGWTLAVQSDRLQLYLP